MKHSTFAVLATAGLTLLSTSAMAAVNLEAGIDAKSAYTSTGHTYNDGFVLQPWFDIDGLKIGDYELPILFEFWANWDMNEYDGDNTIRKGRFQEIDLELDWNLPNFGVEEFSWTVGLVEYFYPQGGYTTDRLVVLRAGYECFLNPSAGIKYRYDGASRGFYEAWAKVKHGFTFDEKTNFGLELSADIWYVDNLKHSSWPDGFACMDFSATLSYEIAYVGATYIWRLDDDVLPTGLNGYDVKWVWSAGVSYSF